ncbi:MAG: DUF4382 domain-containing protein [Sphingobacteriales bacterium]|nr:MAG: DUF4382 domain-containing protein [Sphingobacteriales bacterium]
MKSSVKVISALALLLIGSVVFYACSKEKSAGSSVPDNQQHLSLYLSDDPSIFDKVLLDIKSVEVLVDTCAAKPGRHDDFDEDDHDHPDSLNHHYHCAIWDTLTIKPGVYDVLKLRNGLDTLLAQGNIPKGKVRKIKIDLGPNNSLVKDSVSYPLNLPPGAPSYVIIKLRGDECHEYKPDHIHLWLDFDIARSIIRTYNGKFYLRPVFHFYTISTTGAIEGEVVPREAVPVISVYNSTDTAYALPWHEDGGFKVRGLKEGTYSVFINAGNGYADTTITNVKVTAGKETELGKIRLHK